ncbi:N-6 DNA methylase [Desulfosporosinus burensis]
MNSTLASTTAVIRKEIINKKIIKGIIGLPANLFFHAIHPGYTSVPPDKNGDYAWLIHFIHSLKPQKGKGAIILPHGVLFRGNAERRMSL